MKDSWDKAITWVLYIEGGDTVTNDPADPGGLTKYGISKKSYPSLDIKALTVDDAKRIYKRDYWDKVKADNLPYGLDICVFDTAVNMGVGTALAMMNNAPLYQDYLLNRIEKYIEITRKNATLQKFFRGWMIRCIKLRRLIEG